MRFSLARRVAAAGLIVVTSGGVGAAVAAADGPTSGAGLRVQKLTEDGKPLAGARYEATFCFYDIYSAPADRTWNCTKNDHWVSNDDGYLVLEDESDVNNGIPFEQYPLVYGCPYCGDASEITVVVGVKEVEAPTGYDLDGKASTYYPGYLDDGSDKWGTATSDPGIESGAPTLVSQSQLGDAGTLRQVTGENFSGYEALYTNKYTRSGLDARAVDQASGQGVAGAQYVVRLCDGDPENCRTLPQTFTSGQDGVLRDATGAALASVVRPKMLENATVTLTQTTPADGYEAAAPVTLTHAGGTSGWIAAGDETPKSAVDLPMVKKPTPPPVTEPTTPTTEPTSPTTEPSSPTTPPTSEPTTPTTEPTSPTTVPTSPATTSPTTKTGTPTTEPTTPTTTTSSSSKPTSPASSPTTTDRPGRDHSSSAHGVPSSSSSKPGEGPKVDTDRVSGDVPTPWWVVLGGGLIGGASFVARRPHRGGAYRRR